MNEFTEQVIRLIQSIPPGKVMSYGQVAKSAGNPWGARQVVRILNTSTQKYHLLWHRVVSAKGMISLPGISGQEQKQLLLNEGVSFEDDCIDMSRFQYLISHSSNP